MHLFTTPSVHTATPSVHSRCAASSPELQDAQAVSYVRPAFCRRPVIGDGDGTDTGSHCTKDGGGSGGGGGGGACF